MIAELSAGDELTPSLRLRRPLQQGGMGNLWIAEHVTLGTEVVVKFLARELCGDAECRARFEREAVTTAQVKSPHVIQVFDYGVSKDGVPFMVMELLEGEDLAQRLERSGTLSRAELLDVFSQVGQALGRAHARGIVHRDVKPENIFLCNSGSDRSFVKLLDFGIAKDVERIERATRSGVVLGTPLFMSPEQLVGDKEIDARADLWSLGVLAFHALTGGYPFDAETFGALVLQIHSEDAPVPSRVQPRLPRSFDAWFARACARSKSERFDSVQELVTQLREAIPATLLHCQTVRGDERQSHVAHEGFEIPLPGRTETRHVLFERTGDDWYLNLLDSVHGQVLLETGIIDVAAARAARRGRGSQRLHLPDGAGGKVVVHETEYVFLIEPFPR